MHHAIGDSGRSRRRRQWKRAEKQARTIKYQLTVAKLRLAKDVDDAVGAVSREMEFAI
jgi:hypothetical protein